jgi:hypothetical protein
MFNLCIHASEIYITTLLKFLRTEIQFNETPQLDKSKNDQTIDKQYMKANIKCIKFQGRQYTQDS